MALNSYEIANKMSDILDVDCRSKDPEEHPYIWRIGMIVDFWSLGWVLQVLVYGIARNEIEQNTDRLDQPHVPSDD